MDAAQNIEWWWQDVDRLFLLACEAFERGDMERHGQLREQHLIASRRYRTEVVRASI